MKIRIDLDATPDELRAFLGLPDLRPLHGEVLERLRKGVIEGEEGYDPFTVFQTLLSGGFQNIEAFQEAMRRAAEGYGTGEQARETSGGGRRGSKSGGKGPAA